MIAKGENERAAFLSLRAANDAELAIALARENTARQRSDAASEAATAAEAPNP
jgi:hypothetical protein